MNHYSDISSLLTSKLTYGSTTIRFVRRKATKFSSRDRSVAERSSRDTSLLDLAGGHLNDFRLIRLRPELLSSALALNHYLCMHSQPGLTNLLLLGWCRTIVPALREMLARTVRPASCPKEPLTS
ncbi:hypothetical protein H5410_021662 [Solanum commersonii]|uniref:Uncharacterized protein n=1 Tax=Solanum commersonii TaxID=4109 RepID=A0A9J5ZD68_SOLCO|nr:hypothetical protein H5410_021662 [Solanum commersonii]